MAPALHEKVFPTFNRAVNWPTKLCSLNGLFAGFYFYTFTELFCECNSLKSQHPWHCVKLENLFKKTCLCLNNWFSLQFAFIQTDHLACVKVLKCNTIVLANFFYSRVKAPFEKSDPFPELLYRKYLFSCH